MGAINGYSDDAATTDSDRFLTYASDGTTKLTPASNVNKYIGPGWILSGDTWTYSSWSSTNRTGVMNTNSGATTKYSKGMRVMFTQATLGTKYGIIVAVTTSTLTVYFGTDYQLDNEAISSPVYSGIKAPFGFPLDPAKWTVTTSSTAQSLKSSPTAGTWYGDTGLSPTGPNISIPIGAWRVSYEAAIRTAKTAATSISVYATLSTTSSTESDTDFTSVVYMSAGSATLLAIGTVHREKFVSPTTATTYYLNIKTDVASATDIYIQGNLSTAIIRAVCAYL